MAFEDSEEGVASSREEAGDTRSPCRGQEAWRDLDLRDGGGFSVAQALGAAGELTGGHIMKVLHLQARGLGIIWRVEGSLATD